MGKYQLDYKGQEQVKRFHEKQSKGHFDKKAHIRALIKKKG